MRRIYMAATLCVLAAGALAPRPAQANVEDCRAFRDNIARTEAEPSRPPGWFRFSQQLRRIYTYSCLARAPAKEKEFWYRADGAATGVATDKPRPADASYATTERIAKICAASNPGNPSVCALAEGLSVACGSPADEREAKSCGMQLGGRYKPPAGENPDAPALPPLTITLDGKAYPVGDSCGDILEDIEESAGLSEAARALRARFMQKDCPDLVAGLERRLGVSASNDPARFVTALGGLAQSGFSSTGKAPVGFVTSDPGFQRMCEEAETNMKVCDARFNQFKGAVDQQANRFNDCRRLYGQVLGMCRNGNALLFKAPPLTTGKAPPVQTATQPAAAPPPPATVPPALAAMSPRCQAQLKSLFQSADTGDNAKAAEAYGNLRGADCDGQTREVAQIAQAGLPERQMTARGSSIMNRAMQGDRGPLEATIGNRVNEPAGAGYQFSEVLDFAIAVFGMASTVVGTASALSYVPAAGGNFAARGVGVSRTYGQGSPGSVRTQQNQSTITGIK